MTKKLREPWEYEKPICREIGGDLFYAADEDDPTQVDNNFVNTQMAKKICLECVHMIECREWGVHHESFGVWGGLSPKELSNLRRKRNIPLRSLTVSKFL